MSEEQVDLEEGRKQEILALDAKLATANLFEILGVPAGASVDDVRAAFREASRKFHPDRYYGKELGSFRARIDRIFKKLVEANQTLSDPARRDAYLASNPFVRAAARAAGSQTHLAPVPKSEAEEARDAERRSRLARHPYLARHAKLQESLIKAKAHMQKAEYSQAFTQLNNAAQIDPRNVEAQQLLREVREKAELARSDSSYSHAMEALNRGDTALAMQALRAAVNANPANHKAAATAVGLYEEAGDLKEAAVFAQKAVEAEPKNVPYRLTLARLLMGSGMKALAKKHYEEAARIDPNHPEVKKQGKRLWPF